MDIALLAEGTYPYKAGGVSVWCDQLIRGLSDHRFTVHAITPGDDNEVTWDLPDNVVGVEAVPLWGAGPVATPPAAPLGRTALGLRAAGPVAGPERR